MQYVFVSSTYEDLKNHREMIRKVIGKMGWHPLMMEDFGTETGATVSECLSKVRQADLVVLVVAFKRGWVPRPDQGGRDGKSVTALELNEARRLGKPVRVLLAVPNWPGHLWETDGEARAWVDSFRGELNQIADKFTIEQYDPQGGEPIPGNDFRGRVHQLLLDHRDTLSHQQPPPPAPARPSGLGTMLELLWPLISGVVLPRHELTRAYHCFKPPEWPPPPTELAAPALLGWCAEKLADAQRRHDGRVPLLTFLHPLTRSLPAEQAQPLAGWIEQAIVRLGRDDQDRQLLRSALAAPTPEPVEELGLLLVQVEPSKFNLGAYRLKAWLHGTREVPKRRDGDTDLSLDGLREEIRALCQECEGLCPHCEELRIEFLLPRSLLAFDLDWTPVLDEFGDLVSLCTRHRVVVRPLDRHQKLRAGPLKQPWQRRWTQLENSSQSLCQVVSPLPSEPSDCLVVRAGDAEGDPLVSKFKMLASVVCVIMERPPDPAEPSGKGQFFPSLKAGIPAALWLRGGPDGLADLVGLLQKVELGTLPQFVQTLRLDANWTQDASHLGRRISLMWDDPNRLAPDEDRETNHPLTPPARLPLS